MVRREQVVEVVLTADNTDVLSGSDLESIPAGGVLTVFIASTQDDTGISITGPNIVAIVRDQVAVLRANAEIAQDRDIAYVMPVQNAGRYLISIDVVTAATVRVRAVYVR